MWGEPWGYTTAAAMAVHWDGRMVERKVARSVSPKAAQKADTWAYWSVDVTAAVKAANWERWMVEPMERTSAPQWDSSTAPKMENHLAVLTVAQTSGPTKDKTGGR
jgi:hypothetical protein